MTLSDAVRLGSMKRPQAFNLYFDGQRTCALGAALDAIGFKNWEHGQSLRTAVEHWPILRLRVVNPHSGKQELLSDVIFELNDDACWTRQQIANWVECLEQQQAQPAEALVLTGKE